MDDMGRQCKSVSFEGEGIYIYLKTYSVTIIYYIQAFRTTLKFDALGSQSGK